MFGAALLPNGFGMVALSYRLVSTRQRQGRSGAQVRIRFSSPLVIQATGFANLTVLELTARGRIITWQMRESDVVVRPPKQDKGIRWWRLFNALCAVALVLVLLYWQPTSRWSPSTIISSTDANGPKFSLIRRCPGVTRGLMTRAYATYQVRASYQPKAITLNADLGSSLKQSTHPLRVLRKSLLAMVRARECREALIPKHHLQIPLNPQSILVADLSSMTAAPHSLALCPTCRPCRCSFFKHTLPCRP